MTDIRGSYQRFPSCTQHFWTWLTGKALPHQQPLIRHNWMTYLLVTMTVFLGGLALSSVAIATTPTLWWLMLIAGLVLTQHGARTMILVIAHQSLHRRFSGNPRLDQVIGEMVTVLNVYQDFQTFKEEHFDNHHRRAIFATVADPPVQFLFSLGFLPGMTRSRLRRHAAVVFVSPKFHWVNFQDRLTCNLRRGAWRRAVFFGWAAFWLSVPFWVPNGWLVLLVGFVLPVVILSQTAALLDRLGEHTWLVPPDPEHGSRFYTASATSARFCGSPVPQKGLPGPAAAWGRWLLVTVFYHLPARLMVIVGDLPNHDHHHRHPTTPLWMISGYARQWDIDSGDYGPPYTEVWGMWAAIDKMFDTMSEVPADACLVG
jgi:fatty acid desaturase